MFILLPTQNVLLIKTNNDISINPFLISNDFKLSLSIQKVVLWVMPSLLSCSLNVFHLTPRWSHTEQFNFKHVQHQGVKILHLNEIFLSFESHISHLAMCFAQYVTHSTYGRLPMSEQCEVKKTGNMLHILCKEIFLTQGSLFS